MSTLSIQTSNKPSNLYGKQMNGVAAEHKTVVQFGVSAKSAGSSAHDPPALLLVESHLSNASALKLPDLA